MTRLQLKALINGLIGDNQIGEISADDVREALMSVYDSGILNAGGNGGVMLPIDQLDVRDLDVSFKIIQDQLDIMATTGSSFHYDVVKEIMFVQADIYSRSINIQKLDPLLTMLGEYGSVKTGIIFETLDATNNVVSRGEVGWTTGPTEEFTFLAHWTGGVLSNELRLEEAGMTTLPYAPDTATEDKQIMTFEMYKKLNPLGEVTADVVGAISKAECVNAMNIAGYPFDADTGFKLTATDGTSITDVTYVCNGDIDETGTAYKFLCSQKVEAI